MEDLLDEFSVDFVNRHEDERDPVDNELTAILELTAKEGP